MRIFFAALWAAWPFFALNPAWAQDRSPNAGSRNARSTLAGRVQDGTGAPLPAALVALYRGTDSGVLKTVLSDSAGRFLFGPLPTGPYRLEVEALGYRPYRSGPLLLADSPAVLALPAVALTAAAATGLQEVAVAARKPLLVQRPDRTVVNVDALLSAAGGTALDVLQKSPGVQVDPDGGISLRGKGGVTVYIDDKPSYLSGEDLAAYLRALPASSLDQVELMTNPPARYDAAGTGGIINLKIKRSRAKGQNGSLNLSLMQGRLTSSTNSGTFNYRNNRISTFANVGYSRPNTFTDLDLNRVYQNDAGLPQAYFEQNSYFRRQAHAGTVYAGADYAASGKTTLGVVLSGGYRAASTVNDNTSRILNAAREQDSIIVAHNEDALTFQNGAVNLNYRTRFDENGHGLTADADYLTYRNGTEQAYRNNSFLPDRTPMTQDLLTGHLPARIDIQSLKADYTRPLPAHWQLSAGGKYSSIHTDNLADYQTTAGGVTRPDYSKSNHFLYEERISAAYLNGEGKLGAVAVQAGLRAEHTRTNGHQLGNAQKPDSAFSRDYTSLFPTLYLSYKFDTLSRHQVGLSYGRRVQRPYYQDLNPFLYPMDKFTYYTGNPFLKPAFIQSLELSHTYKDKITTTLGYSRSTDDIDETIEINQGIYYSRPGNIGRKTYLTASVNAVLDPAKWLNLTLYSELTRIASYSPFYTGTLSTSGSFWFGMATARVTAGKGWEAELSGTYRTRIFNAQFIMGPLWQANLAVQKKVSKAVSLKLALNDLFYTRVVRGTITNLAHAEAGWVNRGSSQTAALTVSYRFGEAFKTANRHEANGVDAEKNRVKN